MIILPEEKEVFQKLLTNSLAAIITNRGTYDMVDNCLRLDKLVLEVRDSKNAKHIHHLIMNGSEIKVDYLGDCGRLRVGYLGYEHVPLAKRGVNVVHQLDSKYSFSTNIENKQIKLINFYGTLYNGTIKDIDSSILESELRRDHSFDTHIDNYSLNIIELVHDSSSTVIRIEESGFYVFLDRTDIDDFLLNIDQDRYQLLLELS